MNVLEKDATYTRFDLVIGDVTIIGVDYDAKPCMVGDFESTKFRVVCSYQHSLNQRCSFSGINTDERKLFINLDALFVGSALNFDEVPWAGLIDGRLNTLARVYGDLRII